jgi:hypothetical protein
MKHKPKDIAKLLGTTVEEMLSDVDKTSSASLSELAKKNPKKYEINMLGIVAKNLNISVEELIKYSELKDAIKNQENFNNIDNI